MSVAAYLARPPENVDHLLVVFSDVEMGAGGPLDDFPASDWLAELMLRYCEGPLASLPVTVVFNGDTFDFLKTSVEGTYPVHVDADVALHKLGRIASAHPRFFSGVREFLSHARAERRVLFVLGNHDPELCFPEVQRDIRERCGVFDERLRFPGLSLRIGDVHVEHGCQADPLFAFDPNALVVRHGERDFLNLPWGAVALLDVAIPLTPLLHHHDRLKPRDELLELMPELKRFLLGSFWRYWTRDYWQRYFAADDPLRRVSWTMLREVAYRFTSGSMDVKLGGDYHELIRAENLSLCIVGHSHQPAWHNIGHRKFLQTGCLRHEFALLDAGRAQRPLPKIYAEAYLRHGHVVRSHLVEVDGPEPPPGYVPASIFDVLPEVRRLLAEQKLGTESDREAQHAQEVREEEQVSRMGGSVWAQRFELLKSVHRALTAA